MNKRCRDCTDTRASTASICSGEQTPAQTKRICAPQRSIARANPYSGGVDITGEDALLLTGAFLIAGSLGFSAIMWLAASGRLRPNRWIGYRSDSLLQNAVAWEAGHRAALPIVIATSAAALLLAITGLLLPWIIAKAAVMFLAAVALFGGGLRGQVVADQAADDA